MKIRGCFFASILLCCSAAFATVTGSDDFNDGVINTNLWNDPLIVPGIVEATHTETNGHLHFSSTDIDERAILPWKALAPFDQDWEVQVVITLPDFVNTAEQQYDMALQLTPHSAEQVLTNRLSFGMSKNEANEKKFSENFVTNSIEAHDLDAVRTNDTATLRMRWISFTSNLYTDVSTDGGTTWTNLWVPVTNPFSMSPSDQFAVQLYAGSTGREIAISDNLYCDDFEIRLNDDFDNDGLPNWWEILYFGGYTNGVASLDSDLDGHNNLEESITGMNPIDSNSVFRITNAVPLVDDFLIEWASVSGRIYNVYWTTNLMTEFQPLETDIYYPRNSCTDTVHGAESECFYQVDVWQEGLIDVDVGIQFYNQQGTCVASSNGCTYYVTVPPSTENDPAMVYSSEYWEEYPLYLPGYPAEIELLTTYIGTVAQVNLTIIAETYTMNLDGSNGDLLSGPNSIDIEINTGDSISNDVGFTIPYQAKGLMRLITKLYHEGTLLLTKEAIFCPPDASVLE